MAIKNFDTSARRGDAAVTNAVDVTFQLDGKEMTARAPTTGQMALYIADNRGGYESVQATFQFLADVLGEEDYKLLREALHDGVELALVMDIVNYLIEVWSARPTKSPSASSKSPKSTGRKSTAKRASAKAKTS